MLKELRSQHRNIIQMSFSGFKNNEIAEKTGMSPATISQILRSPLGQAYLNGLIDRAQENTLDVRKKLISLNKDALSTLERILDPQVKAPFNVQLTAAKDVLDRNGYKPSDKFEIDVFSHKTDDEIEAEIRAMEAAIVRNQLAQENLSLTENLQPSSASGTEKDESQFLSEAQEFHPFTLNKSVEVAPSSTSRHNSSLAASITETPTSQAKLSSNNTSQPEVSTTNSGQTHLSFDPSLPIDIQAKLAEQSFDPFQNI